MSLFLFILRIVCKIASLIIFVLTFASAYGGYVSPHIWGLPSVLTLCLPYFALLTLIAGVGWLISRPYIYAILAALTIAGCWGPITSIFPLSSAKEATAGEKPFTVLSYNISHGDDLEGLSTQGNRSFSYVIGSGADIVCLQEMNTLAGAPGLTKAQADSLRNIYPYRVEAKGTDELLLSKYPARLAGTVNAAKNRGANYGGFALYNITMPGGKKLNVLNLHLTSYSLNMEDREVVEEIKGVRSAKNSLTEFKGSIMTKLKSSFRNRADHSAEVREVIDNIKGPLIVCGDFNDVPSSWAYRKIMGEDLRDAYRETAFGSMVTYNEHRFLFHIDQILYRPDGELRALKVERGMLKSSDHYPLLARFAWTGVQ